MCVCGVCAGHVSLLCSFINYLQLPSSTGARASVSTGLNDTTTHLQPPFSLAFSRSTRPRVGVAPGSDGIRRGERTDCFCFVEDASCYRYESRSAARFGVTHAQWNRRNS
jgi:hypothetical protein